jgi:hypothetical protein
MKARPLTLALALLGLLAGHASAQSGNSRGRGKSAAQASSARVKGPSTEIEIRIIRDYYSVPSRKGKSLPPGIARNLARGKPLPPGIAKTRVPDGLLVLLPARTGTRWLIAGDVVLLVDAGDVIVDFIRLAF